jgi:hypothetical protein
MAKKKAKAVHPTKEEIERIKKDKQKQEHIKELRAEREKDVMKELIDSQRAYRIKVKQRLLKQFEIDEMKVELEKAKGTEKEEPKMMWYGKPYPLKILSATISLGIESYQQFAREEMELRDRLVKKYKLTDKEIDKVLEGEYVKEIRT